MKKIAYLFVTLLCVYACATTGQFPQATHPQVPHPEFTRLKTSQIQVGMTPQMIESLFGLPDRTSTTTLGTQTSQPWTALVYEYDMWKPLTFWDLQGLTPEDIARLRIDEKRAGAYNAFYFSLSNNPPSLSSWSVNLTY